MLAPTEALAPESARKIEHEPEKTISKSRSGVQIQQVYNILKFNSNG